MLSAPVWSDSHMVFTTVNGLTELFLLLRDCQPQVVVRAEQTEA